MSASREDRDRVHPRRPDAGDERDRYDDQEHYDVDQEYAEYGAYEGDVGEEALGGDDGRMPSRAGDEAARRRAGAGRGGITAAEAAEAGLRQITALTAKGAEGVTSVEPCDDGWTIGVELLDARRIPSSSDTLSLYEVEIYADGELKSYHRVARYSRARGSSEAS